MPGYFFDSSALVKRYVQESGTRWVRRLTRFDANRAIYLANITVVEVTSAVARRRRAGTVTPARVSSILYRFRRHADGRYILVDLTPSLLEKAARLANTHALRAYDAVQLASAIEVNQIHLTRQNGPVVFVSSDRELNAAAMAEKLVVENPMSHP